MSQDSEKVSGLVDLVKVALRNVTKSSCRSQLFRIDVGPKSGDRIRVSGCNLSAGKM